LINLYKKKKICRMVMKERFEVTDGAQVLGTGQACRTRLCRAHFRDPQDGGVPADCHRHKELPEIRPDLEGGPDDYQAARLVKSAGQVQSDARFPTGFMDVIQIEKTGDNFRMGVNGRASPFTG
jgi:hypothetical protein